MYDEKGESLISWTPEMETSRLFEILFFCCFDNFALG